MWGWTSFGSRRVRGAGARVRGLRIESWLRRALGAGGCSAGLCVCAGYASSACHYQAPLAPEAVAAPAPTRGQLPSATPEADSANAVVVLEAPRSRRSAERVVQSFFDAVRRESLPDLSAVLVDGASISSGPGSSPEPIVKVWAVRFKRLDYGAGSARAPYREDQLAVFTAGELQRLRGTRRYELSPAPGELLAVVTPRDRVEAAKTREFGRRIEFILASTPSGLRILRMFEDFRLP